MIELQLKYLNSDEGSNRMIISNTHQKQFLDEEKKLALKVCFDSDPIFLASA